jgi:hypothetical protein
MVRAIQGSKTAHLVTGGLVLFRQPDEKTTTLREQLRQPGLMGWSNKASREWLAFLVSITLAQKLLAPAQEVCL